ncbi:hypothetical protein VYU27_008312 [Nannochloropsis oceanica]
MAGRAGRRGLDKVGTVILTCWKEVPPAPTLSRMLTGKATLLSSQFRLTYNMILNLLRTEDLSVEDMIKRSFSEFATQRALGARDLPLLLAKTHKALERERKKGTAPCLKGDPPAIEEYYAQSRATALQTAAVVSQALTLAKTGNKLLMGEGRYIKVSLPPAFVNALGMIVKGADAADLLEGGGGGAGGGGGGVGGGVSSRQVLVAMVLCQEGFVPPLPAEGRDDGVEVGEDNKMKRNKKKTTNRERGGGVSPFGGGGHDGLHGPFSSLSLSGPPAGVGQAGREGGGEEPFEVYGSVGSRYYALVSLRLEDVIVVTNRRRKQRLDTEGILATGRAMQHAAKQQAGTSSLPPSFPSSSTSSSVIMDVMDELLKTEKEEAKALAEDSLPPSLPLDPLNFPKDLKINDLDFMQSYSRLLPGQQALLSSKCHTCPLLLSQYTHIHRLRRLEQKASQLEHWLSNESLALFPDFQQRLAVLGALGYIDLNSQVVQLKGRAACEVNTCEELLLTEMVFDNVLEPLEPAEIAGLLSVFVCQEKSGKEEGGGKGTKLDVDSKAGQAIPPALRVACGKVLEIARHLGDVQRCFNLPTDPESFATQHVNLALVDVVYEWARGVNFKDIMEISTVQEGSIVRCITRLDELCREVRNAARMMGDPALYRKMEVVSQSIKRDIVFAGSLYLS